MSGVYLFLNDLPHRPMNSELFDEASKMIPDQQVLINMVSKRVRQLCASSRPLIDADPRMGLMEIALAEIAQGKLQVRHLTGEEKQEAA